jgi:hypothetical protein
MGYSTDFHGEFNCEPALADSHRLFLKKFAETRRMKRDSAKAENMDDPLREEVALEIGEEGAFYVGGEGYAMNIDGSVLDHNRPPEGQPGLWCQWVPNETGSAIEWDEGEKFYHYAEWLQYIIDNFLDRWGYMLNGQVKWQGEDASDFGIIKVQDSVMEVVHGEQVMETERFSDKELELANFAVRFLKSNLVDDVVEHLGESDDKALNYIEVEKNLDDLENKINRLRNA